MVGILTVRTHHLVCLAEYAVDGGDHPTLPILLRAFRENPDRSVRVVVGPDDICTPCPYWDGVTCTREVGMEEKNRAKDAKFLDLLGLADGEVSTARELQTLIAGRVTADALHDICPTCSPDACAEAVRHSWLEV